MGPLKHYHWNSYLSTQEQTFLRSTNNWTHPYVLFNSTRMGTAAQACDMLHCIKYRNFTLFFGVEILWKDIAIRPKLCGNCAFPQNLRTRILGETTVFYAVLASVSGCLWAFVQCHQKSMFGQQKIVNSLWCSVLGICWGYEVRRSSLLTKFHASIWIAVLCDLNLCKCHLTNMESTISTTCRSFFVRLPFVFYIFSS